MTATSASGPQDAATPGRSWQQQTSWRHIWSISWPVFLANITFPLVGAADTAMMGRLDNASFVGGVALGTLVFNFIYFGFGFVRMCTTGLVAQAHGRGADREIENHMIRGLIVALAIGFGFVIATPLVIAVTTALFSASESVRELMKAYVEIRLMAVPAALANMVLLGCLFGRQNMRLVMVQISFVNVINLGLNIYFVIGLGMAIEGVAWASVAAQWIGLFGTLALVRWQWRDLMAGIAGRLFMRRPAWLDPAAFGHFFVIGGDIMIRTLLLLLSEAVLLDKAAGLGDVELASIQLVLVMFGLISFGLDGYAHAAEALVGEAVGRRHPRMLAMAVRRTNILCGISAVVISLAVWVSGDRIVALLTSQPDLAAMTLSYWHWVALLAPVAFLAFQMDGIFVGATRSREMRNAMILAAAGFFILVTLFDDYGLNGLLAAFTIYLGLRGVTLLVRMKHVYAMATPDAPTQDAPAPDDR